jgi:hypothetical protein
MGRDLVVELVAQHLHVLETFPASILKRILVVPDLRLPEEVEPTAVDDPGATAELSCEAEEYHPKYHPSTPGL